MRILLGVLLCVMMSANALAGVHKEVQKDVKTEDSAPARADGTEWLKWNDARKASFVEGFLAGSIYMIEAGVTQTKGLDEDKLAEMSIRLDRDRFNPVFTGTDLAEWSAMEREYLVKQRNDALMKYIVRGVSNAQIIEGLDAIYKDAANLAIPITDAVYLAKRQVLKARQDEIDGLVRYLREGKKDPTLLKIENEDGELVRFIQFP